MKNAGKTPTLTKKFSIIGQYLCHMEKWPDKRQFAKRSRQFAKNSRQFAKHKRQFAKHKQQYSRHNPGEE